jgi:anaerobic magnesium-protoporphyrin IX monomethyl ester cyclase
MRVLLVGPDLEENLSLRYLASSLRKAGHCPTIAAFETPADTPAVLAAAASAHFVGLSMCYQVRAGEFLALARALKQDRPGRPIVAGGHYASCAAAELLAGHEEIDLILVHESERILAELASLPAWTPAALAGVPGLVYRAAGKVETTAPRAALADLDSLPWPDRSGPARLMTGVPTAYLMGSRGCLSACDYCCISTMHRMVSGARFRQRSPEDIVAEMASLYHERGIRQFIFHDDNFLVPQVERNLARIDAIDRGLRRHGLRQIALALKCRPADVDRRVFTRLRDMGLLRIFLGIESGSREGLASIGRHQTIAQEHHALDLCADLGISTQYTIIMFHPEATLRSMREDLAFVATHADQPMSYCRAEIYTGTPLEQRMVRAGRVFGDYLAREYEYTDALTRHAWNASRRLLAQRCFGPNHLLGQVVRLDHQAAVLRHFYEGRDVAALVTEIADFERAVNLDTIALIERLFTLCEDHPDAKSPAFAQQLDEMCALERGRYHDLFARACAFREALAARSLGVLGLARGGRPSGERSFLERLPRHAAAVFLAVGLLNCNSESGLKSTPDGATDGLRATDAVSDGRFTDQGGMFEAPPPPMDARPDQATDLAPDLAPDASQEVRNEAGVNEAVALDGDKRDVKQDTFVDQRGMFEGPPDPPMDARKDVAFLDQGGMFEAPPPPMDAKKN